MVKENKILDLLLHTKKYCNCSSCRRSEAFISGVGASSAGPYWAAFVFLHHGVGSAASVWYGKVRPSHWLWTSLLQEASYLLLCGVCVLC